MTDADHNDSSQAAREGMPASDEDEAGQNQYGGAGDDEGVDPVEQTERQDGARNDADEDDD